jgi:hypothetical protein
MPHAITLEPFLRALRIPYLILRVIVLASDGDVMKELGSFGRYLILAFRVCADQNSKK